MVGEIYIRRISLLLGQYCAVGSFDPPFIRTVSYFPVKHLYCCTEVILETNQSLVVLILISLSNHTPTSNGGSFGASSVPEKLIRGRVSDELAL